MKNRVATNTLYTVKVIGKKENLIQYFFNYTDASDFAYKCDLAGIEHDFWDIRLHHGSVINRTKDLDAAVESAKFFVEQH